MTTHRLSKFLTAATANSQSEHRGAIAILAAEFPDKSRTEVESALLAAIKSTSGAYSRQGVFDAARASLSAAVPMAAA